MATVVINLSGIDNLINTIGNQVTGTASKNGVAPQQAVQLIAKWTARVQQEVRNEWHVGDWAKVASAPGHVIASHGSLEGTVSYTKIPSRTRLKSAYAMNQPDGKYDVMDLWENGWSVAKSPPLYMWQWTYQTPHGSIAPIRRSWGGDGPMHRAFNKLQGAAAAEGVILTLE